MRKFRPWILSLLFFVVLLLIAGIAATRWLSSESFHHFIEQKSSSALNATASIGPLRWGWFELFSQKFDAEGTPSSSLRKLDAEGLHGRLNPLAILHGLWRVEAITLEKATLHIDASRSKEKVNARIQKEAHSDSLFPAWVPTLLVIDEITTGKADVFIKLSDDKSLEIHGAQMEVYPEGNEIRIEGQKGVLGNPYLPDLDIDTVRCRIKPSVVELTGADLSFPEGGNIYLEGTFPDIEESTLDGRWEMVPIATVLPMLKQQVVGTLNGTASARWNQEGAQSINGTLQAHNVILSNIPMLDEVSSLTRMDAFHHLFLQQAQGKFSLKDGNSSWHDVVLESKGLIKLVGEAEYKKNGSLSGSFQLGLSSPIVRVIPGAAQVFSKDQHDGYYWTLLGVGGSLSHPTEDLTPRITSAILSNAGLLLQQGVKQGLQILGISGGNPPTTTNPPSGTATPVDDLKQSGGAVLDTIGGFLK